MKYPSTPYYTFSPSVGRGDRYIDDPSQFTNKEIVITEKMDGSTALLYQGDVYDRSNSTEPSSSPWFAMARKYHSWKTFNHEFMIYGEDIYGVHSIEYNPVKPQNTFMAFALYNPITRMFLGWDTFESMMEGWDIPTVPVIFRGKFNSTIELNNFLTHEHGMPSSLGGHREGMVIRTASTFHLTSFGHVVCKSVRPDHVQQDAEHWSKNWKACKLA